MQFTSSPSLARRVRWGAEIVLEYSGLASLYGRAREAGAVVLMYHSVADAKLQPFIDPRVRTSPERFARQMSLVAERRAPLGMSELMRRKRSGDLPHGSVVVTFDDGYLDTLTTAAPILARFGIPAIVYLPTDYIDRGEAHWVDRLYTAFHHRRRSYLRLPDGSVIDLRSAMGRTRAHAVLEPTLSTMTMAERRDLLSDIEDQLSPSQRAPRLTMNWDDVRTLIRRYPRIELGCHTAQHLDLTSLPPEQVRSDLRRAQARAKAELGMELHHFSYPYSRDSTVTRGIVKRLGFESAAGSGDQYRVDEVSDPHNMARIEPGDSLALLRFWTSGAYPDLSRAMWGHA